MNLMWTADIQMMIWHLHVIIDKVQKAIEDRGYSCGIFLDFSEAFDTVNHEMLLTKREL